MTPFFQASRRSLAYQFTIIAPLLCPHFQILEKFSIFSLVLVKISALKTQNFPNFRSLDPSFFKENPLPRPYFWKPVWHIPTQKKVECPPPPRARLLPLNDTPGMTLLFTRKFWVNPDWKLVLSILPEKITRVLTLLRHQSF